MAVTDSGLGMLGVTCYVVVGPVDHEKVLCLDEQKPPNCGKLGICYSLSSVLFFSLLHTWACVITRRRSHLVHIQLHM